MSSGDVDVYFFLAKTIMLIFAALHSALGSSCTA